MPEKNGSNQTADLERRVAILEEQMRRALGKLNLPADPDDVQEQVVKRNDIGQYSIKVIYPTWYELVDDPYVGFPKNRRKLAQRVRPGQLMFLYVTMPEKAIIGLARVKDSMRENLHPGAQWPYEFPLELVIGPKLAGVQFADVGVNIRPRVGDTLYSVAPEKAQEIKDRLNELPDLTPEQIRVKVKKYEHLKKSKSAE